MAEVEPLLKARGLVRVFKTGGGVLGGGVYLDGDASFSDCTMDDNLAVDGSAIYGSLSALSTAVIRCTFDGNVSSQTISALRGTQFLLAREVEFPDCANLLASKG